MDIVNKFKPFYRFLKKEDILQNNVVNYAEMQHYKAIERDERELLNR